MSVIISSLLIIIVVIYLLAIVTDEYFIESLDVIAQKWKLPSNVAGASLMAMGSSMPELSIALFALMQQGGAHSDVGVGNMVGSAIFNILVITGVSALVMPARVTFRVIVRDCLIYTISIGLLIAFFLDGQITMLEALLFLGLYALYILILFQWNRFAPAEEDQEGDAIQIVEAELEEERAKSGVYHRITSFVSHIFRFFTGDPRRNYLRTFTVSILLIAGISWLLVEQSVLLADALSVFIERVHNIGQLRQPKGGVDDNGGKKSPVKEECGTNIDQLRDECHHEAAVQVADCVPIIQPKRR